MANHFVAQILKDKGPDPEAEIAGVIAEAEKSERAHAIFATRMTGKDWRPARPAYAVVFYRRADGSISGLVAEIVNRLKDPTNIPPIYDAWRKAMKGWWHLKNPRRIKEGVSLKTIPGFSAATGTPADSAFDGNATFAYWDFEESPYDALCEPDED
jgi:hypothetical protein